MSNGILSQGSIVSQPTLDNTPTFTNGSIPIVTGWIDIAYSTELLTYVAISTTLGGQCSVATSSNGKDWSFKQNILPDSGNAVWKSIAYGNGLFIAVTNSSVAAYSKDAGVTWTQFTIPNGLWIKIIQGNSTFVLVPSTGVDAYTSPMSSTNLTATWTKVALSPSTSPWVDAVYGGSGLGFFVISSGTNATYSSVNGATWTARTLPSNQTWTSVTFGGGGKFVIAGSAIFTNPNLNTGTWTKANTPVVDSWTSIAAGGFNLAAISTGNSNIATVSTDGGATWYQTTLATTSNWTSIKYGSEIYGFVAISANSSSTSVGLDGTDWTLGKMPCYALWTGVNYNEGKFVAVSSGNNVIAVSDDALTWEHKKLSAKLDWRSMAYGNGYFVTLANSSNSVAYSSDSAQTWTTVNTLPGTNSKWVDVTYGNNTFIAIHETGAAISLDNAATWTAKTLPALTNNAKYNRIIFGKDTFIVTSTISNAFQVSTDVGKNWSTVSVPNADWVDIAFGNLLFVAVDKANGTIITSTDANYWVERQGPLNEGIKKVNFANDRFVITYNTDDTFTTSDFTSWSGPVVTEISSVASAYGKGVLLYLSNSNTDVNGILTTTASLPFADAWISLTYGALGYIAIMKNNGIYATSTDGNMWVQRNLPFSGPWTCVQSNGSTHSVIVATGIKALHSSNSGETYEEVAMPVSANWQSIAYGNNYFVAVSNGTNVAVSSNNGITWTAGASLPAASSWKITYTGSYFLAVASNGRVVKSVNNASSWTELTALAVPGDTNIVFGNNSILVTNNTQFGYLSVDAGLTWDRVLMPTGYKWKNVAYGNGMFVAIAPKTKHYATSTDGIVWTLRTLLSRVDWVDITYANGSFVTISTNSTDIAKIDYPINSSVYTCPDGKTMSGKLLVSFNDFDPLNSKLKTCSVRVNDMNYRLGLASDNSLQSNITLNSFTIPLVLGSNQALRVETANVDLEPKYILTGYEE